MKAAFEYVIKKIIESPIIEEPYPHMLISGIFPDEFYSVLLEQIPNTSTYTSKPKYPGRKTMTLDNFDILDEEKKEFWKEIYGFLRSDKFTNILLQKFNISKNGVSDLFLHKDLENFELKMNKKKEEKISDSHSNKENEIAQLKSLHEKDLEEKEKSHTNEVEEFKANMRK